MANAGLPASGKIEDFTAEEIDRALDVNLRAAIQLAHAAVPGMVERGRGHLVFMSSLAGKVATARSTLYSATKFGLRGFAAGLRADLHGTGVGVTAVFPGFVSEAGLFADAGVTLPRGVGTRTPEQVARAVVRGIEQGKPEIDVAPIGLRAGALKKLRSGDRRSRGRDHLVDTHCRAPVLSQLVPGVLACPPPVPPRPAARWSGSRPPAG